ncbi:hypothetical protein C1H46_013104 [Malus baccata]|uniref:Uncharacterized protein n=1 Tax=Malus baccata TaxID=106549 RepID=A0A540MR88_MALBA|nr:hypothetical protein C1H46_013104 [Malus baccata]
MATLPSSVSSSSRPLLPLRRPPPIFRSFTTTTNSRTRRFSALVFASSASPFDDLRRPIRPPKSKKSVLSDLIQEIEPLNVSLIQKDVPPTTVDAMKRTISGMLGLLPSDQFQVLIEALWEPLSKLLVSSMMTGYTLRNAEYRLCLERNFDLCEDKLEKQTPENGKVDLQGMLLESANIIKFPGKDKFSSNAGEVTEDSLENIDIQGLGEVSPEAQQYILQLQAHLSSAKKHSSSEFDAKASKVTFCAVPLRYDKVTIVKGTVGVAQGCKEVLSLTHQEGLSKVGIKDYMFTNSSGWTWPYQGHAMSLIVQNGELKGLVNMKSHVSPNLVPHKQKELHEVKRKSAALQMQQFVGEEKNDLLDYLRSLQPEEVAELSEPTSPELREIIHSVIHGLLATLSPKMHSKAPPSSESASAGVINGESEDCAELVENTSLHFQPLISLTRDYLARLLFWCMLLGHYLKGLEYRMELTELLSLTSNAESDTPDDDQTA